VTRLGALTEDALDDAGRALWAQVTASRGDRAVNADGSLLGPFNAWLHAPALGARLTDLGTALRFEGTLEARLRELAIITVAAHHRVEFEWWAHSRMARRAGLASELVDAIGRGEAPPIARDDERAVYDVAAQLLADARIDDAAFAAAHAALGDAGLVELVALCGYYTTVSFTLNAFGVPLPEGVAPIWA
jgi:4-carboxymuconolactone decarboxylase